MIQESQNTEWKERWQDDYLKWICGFANAEGGVLIIGRNDKGDPVGVSDAKRLLENLPNKIRDLLGIVVEVNLKQENGYDLIEIETPPYASPISYRGHYYQRSGSTLQELRGATLDRFILVKQGRAWDGVPMPQIQAGDLSEAAIAQFRKFAQRSGRLEEDALKESDENLLDKLMLTEGEHLKRAAALLFHPEPQRFASGASVKIAYFRSDAELGYQDEITGPLIEQPRLTIETLRLKYLKAAISYEGIQRIETFPVPDAALREAILNALIHRDYAVAAPVQIRVYDDKLRIWNPAELPAGWTKQKLIGEHSSRPFNPAIAQVFFRAGEIEAWGHGIQRIFKACKDAGTPKPKISYDPGEISIEFPFSKTYIQTISGASSPTSKTGERLDEKLDKKLDEKLGENRARIIQLMRANSRITVTEIGKQLGMSRTAADKNIQILKRDGWVKRIGPAKGGHWEVILKEEG